MKRATRILIVADEVSPRLDRPEVKEIRPDLVVSCGDLPYDYLEYLVSLLNVPLVFVPGNHDPSTDSQRRDAVDPESFSWAAHFDEDLRPHGCQNIDNKIVEVAGLRIAGLGGCIRYNEGPHQYTQREMAWRATKIEMRGRARGLKRRKVDLLVTHAPPEGCGDGPDAAHKGIGALHRLTRVLAPQYLLHGHIHPHGFHKPDRRLGDTTVVNVVPFKILEIEA
jgi:Icc-related predicted phosphoesterase